MTSLNFRSSSKSAFTALSLVRVSKRYEISRDRYSNSRVGNRAGRAGARSLLADLPHTSGFAIIFQGPFHCLSYRCAKSKATEKKKALEEEDGTSTRRDTTRHGEPACRDERHCKENVEGECKDRAEFIIVVSRFCLPDGTALSRFQWLLEHAFLYWRKIVRKIRVEIKQKKNI